MAIPNNADAQTFRRGLKMLLFFLPKKNVAGIGQ